MARHLHQRIGKHRLQILIDQCLRTSGIGIEHLVVRDAVTQDMITQEHIQHIGWVLIVLSRADGNVIVAVIVIPAFGGSTILIDILRITEQVFNIVDAVLFQHFISFCKDGIAHLADIRGIHLTVTLARIFLGHDDAFSFQL